VVLAAAFERGQHGHHGLVVRRVGERLHCAGTYRFSFLCASPRP
jgi:hypothetical protein